MTAETKTPGGAWAAQVPDYDQPKWWMRQAEGSLVIVRSALAGVLPEHRLFHAQQAAEKALKGVLMSRELLYPHTHNIAVLIDLLREGGVAVPDKAEGAKDFTRFESRARYPVVPPLNVTGEYCDIAADITAAIVEWAKTEIAKTEGDDV